MPLDDGPAVVDRDARTRQSRQSWRRSTIPEQIEVELPAAAGRSWSATSTCPVGGTQAQRRWPTSWPDCWTHGRARGFVIAGDGFEMLAGPPDVDAILDAHPQFTEAVARFAARTPTAAWCSCRATTTASWPGTAQAVARPAGRDSAWRRGPGLDLLIETGQGTQLVRVVHGNQFDPYNAFEDPWSPVDTPFGHHVVRDLLPELESRQRPGSLLEGVQWLDGDTPTSSARGSSTARSSASCGGPCRSWPSCCCGC